jgi:predicted SAM-dependent methyltransferase
MTKLHLGCGKKRLPGYVHVDSRPDVKPDVVAKAEDLSRFADGTIEVVYACHLLEHFKFHDVVGVLKEWKRVLMVGGVLRLSVPNTGTMCVLYARDGVDLDTMRWAIMGGQDYPENFHLSIWDYKSLGNALKQAGFTNYRRWDPKKAHPPKYRDFSLHFISGTNISLNVEAVK